MKNRKQNAVEKYTIFEMFLILIFAPFILIRQMGVLIDLKEQNYKLKFKQRLVLLIIGMILWFSLFYIEFKKWQKKEFNSENRYELNCKKTVWYNSCA